MREVEKVWVVVEILGQQDLLLVSGILSPCLNGDSEANATANLDSELVFVVWAYTLSIYRELAYENHNQILWKDYLLNSAPTSTVTWGNFKARSTPIPLVSVYS